MHTKILILDFGSQFTQLIARRVRDIGVFSEVLAHDVSDDRVRQYGAAGIILSGGPNSVTHQYTPRAPQVVFELGIPVLGICYGMQTMAEQLGGQVLNSTVREFGHATVEIHDAGALLKEIADAYTPHGPGTLHVWMSHGDKVHQLPTGFKRIASTPHCPYAAIADETRRFYGVQFHPEVTHTPQGQAIFTRFVIDICCAQANWNMPNFIDESMAQIRQHVGHDHVILGLSGGVDSSVAAVLIHRAIGSQLTCVFVDHGLLRQAEAQEVMTRLAHLGLTIVQVNTEKTFMAALAGVADPEIKRKIIGREFVAIFEREAKTLKASTSVKWLAQGTIYPDVIESAGNHLSAHTIKSHHNVGGLPKTLQLCLLEPLRSLFKDEVRKLGLALGLPAAMVYRHPFPGPGLAVRILGEVKKEYVDVLRQADAIFIEELHAAQEEDGTSWYDKTSQAFAVFLPVKSVGVIGDTRTYDYVIALRAVQSQDFMSAHWAHLPHALLARVSNRIINEVRGVSRVVYDISSKPPATIEWE